MTVETSQGDPKHIRPDPFSSGRSQRGHDLGEALHGRSLEIVLQIRTTDHPSSFSLRVFARSRFTRSPLEYSDTLLIFLLKGVRPQKYRDNVRQEISGPDGSPLLPAKIIIECVRTPTMEEFDAKHQLPTPKEPAR